MNVYPLLPKMSEPKIVNLIVRAARILQTLSNGNSRIGKISEVVLAVGMKPVDRMANELKGMVTSLHVIGDCARLGKVRDAIAAGYRAALEI